MALPSNQNELGPNALVITGFGSHPCHLLIYYFFLTLSFLEMYCLATCCLLPNSQAHNGTHALGDPEMILECLQWLR